MGEVPEVDWSAMLEPGETQAEVVEEGTGAVIEEGDKVLHQPRDLQRRGPGHRVRDLLRPGLLLKVGAEAEPTQVVDLMTNLVNEEIEPGTTTVGTRIAITADAEEEFGDLALNLATLGIGNEDGFVLVADLEAVPLDGPEGKTRPAPSWAPEIVEKKGEPTALDSSACPSRTRRRPSSARPSLIEGTGPVVEKGQQIVANYIGQVYAAKEPFDNGTRGRIRRSSRSAPGRW